MLVNFCLAFQRFLYRPRVGLGPQMPVKTAHDARQFFPGVSAVPPPTARRFMAQDLGVLPKKQHRVLANFLFGVFAVVYTTARGFRTPNARKNRTECS